MAPPPTAHTVHRPWACGVAVDSLWQYKWRHRGDFWNSSPNRRYGAPKRRPAAPPSAQKIEKIFFLIFEFLLFGKCTGMFNSPEKCIYEWEMADFYSFSLSPTIVSHFHDFEQISLALPNFFHCEDYHPRHLFSLLTSHFLSFLGADKHLYKMVCPSVGPSVSIGP